MLPLALVALAAAAAPHPPHAAPPVVATRVVVLDVATEEKGIKPSSLAALSDLVTLELGRYRPSSAGKSAAPFDVLSGREIRDALKLEGERQSIGCDKTSCAGEIAQAFGARYVVFLVLVRLGANLTLNLSLYDSQEARVVGRAAAQADTVAALAPLLPGSVRTMVAAVVHVDDIAPAPIALPERPRGREERAPGISISTAAFPDLGDDEIPLMPEPLTAEDASICAYDETRDAWHCGGTNGAVVVEERRAGGAVTAGVGRFSASVRGGCVESVDVELQAGDEPVTVDWRDAVFVVDGEAVPARPLRPYERATSAPAGVVAREVLVPRAGRCIGSTALGVHKDHDSAALTLGFTVGRTPARAKWLRVRTRATVDERTLIALLPAPELPPPPADPVDAGADAPFPTGLVAGLSTGGGLAALTGVFVGGVWMPKSAAVGDRALAGAGYGAVCFACLGLPLAGVGMLVDGTGAQAFADKQRETARFRTEQKRVDAYHRALTR